MSLRLSRDADIFYRSCLTSLVEQISEARIDSEGEVKYPTPKEGRVPCRITLKDKICAVLDYRFTHADFGPARDFFEESDDPQLLAIADVLRETCKDWRREGFDFIKKLASDWDLRPLPANNEVDPNANELANLNIDQR